MVVVIVIVLDFIRHIFDMEIRGEGLVEIRGEDLLRVVEVLVDIIVDTIVAKVMGMVWDLIIKNLIVA